MPFFGTRRFDVHTKRTFMNTPPNERGSNEGIVMTEIGHVGTQLDGFTHQSHRNSLYNCFEIDEISTRSGFEKLGIDKVGMLMGRGVLITDHNVRETLDIVDRACIIYDGKVLFAGSPEALVANEE